MAKLFDPRKVLRQVSNALLKESFGRRGELEEVPWGELKETHIGPIFDGWQALPDDDRNEVQVLLQDVNELADERGLGVLAEEIQWRAPERLKEFGQWEGRMDRVMWAHLKMSEAFEEAALFARADALAAGRFWVKRNSLPAGRISVDGKVRTTFEEALSEHYWPTEMRGKYCAVEHYQRGNGAEYLAGDVIDLAAAALVDAIVYFFPTPPWRDRGGKTAAKKKEVEALVLKAVDRFIDSGEIEKKVQEHLAEQLGPQFGDAPASSA